MNKEIKEIKDKVRASLPKKYKNKPKPLPKPEQARLRRSLNSSIDSLHGLNAEVQINLNEVLDEIMNRKIGYMKQEMKD